MRTVIDKEATQTNRALIKRRLEMGGQFCMHLDYHSFRFDWQATSIRSSVHHHRNPRGRKLKLEILPDCLSIRKFNREDQIDSMESR